MLPNNNTQSNNTNTLGVPNTQEKGERRKSRIQRKKKKMKWTKGQGTN